MRYEDFITYAKRLAVMGVQGFILTGGGEPTINPDFEKIAGWLTENNFQWGINTNFNKLVKVKPNYLKVSLDAYSNESYRSYHGRRYSGKENGGGNGYVNVRHTL